MVFGVVVACTPPPPKESAPPLEPAPATVLAEPEPAPAVEPPASIACATVPVEDSKWTPPVSTSKGVEILAPPRMRLRGLAAARHVRDALARRCRGKPVEPPSDMFFDPEEWDLNKDYYELGADDLGKDRLLFRTFVSDEGVYAEHTMDATLHDLRACTSTALNLSYSDSALIGRVFERPEELLALVVGPRLDPANAAHGYATLLTGERDTCGESMADALVRGPAFALLPLPFPAQAWHPGAPPVQTRVWLPHDAKDHQTGDRVGALAVEAPDPPRLLTKVGDLQIHGAGLRGRNGGLALALYDPAGDRHRWLLATRGCLMGTQIHWLASGSGLIVGYALSQHPIYQEEEHDGLFVIDASNARAYRLLLDGSALTWPAPEPAAEANAADDAEVAAEDAEPDTREFDPTPRQVGQLRVDEATLRSRCGSRVTLADLRAVLDVLARRG